LLQSQDAVLALPDLDVATTASRSIMTDPYSHPQSYRRLNQPFTSSSSYASVAAGAGSHSSTARFGALSHLLHPEDDPPI
ncbi:hypothetical protein KCU67_g13502, partial [Aureobasidium melanogenum]